jgi:hypothetical protein
VPKDNLDLMKKIDNEKTLIELLVEHGNEKVRYMALYLLKTKRQIENEKEFEMLQRLRNDECEYVASAAILCITEYEQKIIFKENKKKREEKN